MDKTPQDADPALASPEPRDDPRFLASFGWFVLGAAAVLGATIGSAKAVTQTVRVLALLILLAGLVVSLLRGRRGPAAAAGAGLVVGATSLLASVQ